MRYHSYSVALSDGQELALAKAYKNNQAVTIYLKNKQLTGNDEMMLTKRQINKIKKSISNKAGTDINLSKSHANPKINKSWG